MASNKCWYIFWVKRLDFESWDGYFVELDTFLEDSLRDFIHLHFLWSGNGALNLLVALPLRNAKVPSLSKLLMEESNPAKLTSWGLAVEIPLFAVFYISQVVGLGISEPSTVRDSFSSCFWLNMVPKCQPWLSPLFCFIQSTGCWGSDLDISSHMKTGAPHNTLWKPSASGHVTDSSGQEKTISKQHWQQASWTETKPVVGKAHNCPTRVLSPTSQTKKKTDCYSNHCIENMWVGDFPLSFPIFGEEFSVGTWPTGARQRIVVDMWTSPATSPTLWWHPLRGSKN